MLDVNDYRPRFARRAFNTSVFENEPSGTSIITLSATDLDEGENGLLTYSMQGAGAGTTPCTHYTHMHTYTQTHTYSMQGPAAGTPLHTHTNV